MQIRISIQLEGHEHRIHAEELVPGDRVEGVIGRVLGKVGINEPASQWELVVGDHVFLPNYNLGVLLKPETAAVLFVLRRRKPDTKRGWRESGAVATPTRASEPLPASSVAQPSVDRAAATLPPPPPDPQSRWRAKAKKAKVRPKVEERRATVRYYSRMNPNRVFPFLVVVSKQMVDEVRKQGTTQKAGESFQVDVESAVEVEPVLPGCMCYPPKMTTRVSDERTVLKFHVVPQVTGSVSGAKVMVRQDHTTLSEVPLKIKVVQTTAFYTSAVLTFLLPFLSTLAKQYGLDLESQVDRGFDLYLGLAELLFRVCSPLVLTLGLGCVTGGFYLWSRPRKKDVFWEISSTPAGIASSKDGSS